MGTCTATSGFILPPLNEFPVDASLRSFWTRVNQESFGNEILERRSDVRLRSRRFDSVEIPDQPLHDRVRPSLPIAALPDRSHRPVQDVEAGGLRIEEHQLEIGRASCRERRESTAVTVAEDNRR